MSLATFKRFEIKFLLDEQQFKALMPILMRYMKLDKHCQNGKKYNVYNIYYDTLDNHFIKTSLAKPYYKEKLRLRTYHNPISLDSDVFLELKKKTAGIVHKRRAVIKLKEAYEFIELGKHPLTRTYIDEQVVREIDYFLGCNKVYPTVYISYSRIALFGKEDKNFRITFDTSIKTRRKDLFLEKGDFGQQLLGENQYLMEVKIDRAVPIWLANTLAELKIYKTSFSKYGREYQKYCLRQGEKICTNY